MKVDTMSRNVVRVMKLLSKNVALQMLLINHQNNPMSHPVSEEAVSKMLNPTSPDAKILPYPFSIEAETEDGVFLRVYYNNGEFNKNETFSMCDLHIDIVVAKSLWLMYDDTKNESLIRTYEIMDRVVDLVGRRGIGDVRLDVEGFQHHYINTKFDCVRLYCNYTSVETMKQEDR